MPKTDFDSGSIAPAPARIGDAWFDSTNLLEKIFTGQPPYGWIAIGPALNTFFSNPGNLTGTTSTAAAVMMGIAATITLQRSGKIFVLINGDAFNNGPAGDGTLQQIRYGTGAAPVNSAAATGTTLGGNIDYISANGTEKSPFCLIGIATGLTLGTTYWFDVGLTAVGGGTGSIQDVSVVLIEV